MYSRAIFKTKKMMFGFPHAKFESIESLLTESLENLNHLNVYNTVGFIQKSKE